MYISINIYIYIYIYTYIYFHMCVCILYDSYLCECVWVCVCLRIYFSVQKIIIMYAILVLCALAERDKKQIPCCRRGRFRTGTSSPKVPAAVCELHSRLTTLASAQRRPLPSAYGVIQIASRTPLLRPTQHTHTYQPTRENAEQVAQ